tara:strand:- start:355 stop:534 length:180 start_codon:yes stop_codon:yes gene_type:complete
MKDKSYEMFLEIIDREHESLVPDKTIPTFNIWDMRKDQDESSRIKREVSRVARLQTTSK